MAGEVLAQVQAWGVHTESVSGEAGLKPALAKGGAAAANAVDAASKLGETALMLAADKGAAGKVAALLAAGAKVDALDKRGRSALHYAVAGGSPACVQALLGAKADGRLKDKDKISPAALARAKGYADIAVLLK